MTTLDQSLGHDNPLLPCHHRLHKLLSIDNGNTTSKNWIYKALLSVTWFDYYRSDARIPMHYHDELVFFKVINKVCEVFDVQDEIEHTTSTKLYLLSVGLPEDIIELLKSKKSQRFLASILREALQDPLIFNKIDLIYAAQCIDYAFPDDASWNLLPNSAESDLGLSIVPPNHLHLWRDTLPCP